MRRPSDRLDISLEDIKSGKLVAGPLYIILAVLLKEQVSSLVFVPDVELGKIEHRDAFVLSIGSRVKDDIGLANGVFVTFMYRPSNRQWDSFTTTDDIEIVFVKPDTILYTWESCNDI
jgi:hypothetical protein